MKIIIFDGSFKTTAFINRLVEGLVSNDVEVFVLGFNEELKQPLKGVKYIALGSSASKWKFMWTSLIWGLRSKSLLKTLKRLTSGDKSQLKRQNLTAALEYIQPDVVHVQWVSNISLFEDLLKPQTYKFVLSQRGYQTNVRPFVDKANFEYLQHWLPRFSGFHSVSQAISKEGNKIYNSPNKIDHVVYTGLELSKFEFNPLVVQNEVLEIISVGRPHWKKGYDIALKALALLKKKGLQLNYQIIGAEGNQELLFLRNELDLETEVEFLPKLPQQKVFEMMSSSDIFLLSSIEEGIANVAVEAMALGCPVISTNCGGMEELITHQKEGWIVPVYDYKAMAAQILEFSQLDSEYIKNIKHAARLKVEQQHTEMEMVEGMMRLYNRVVR
ncbi:colanic acid biosynthesis glycosyltransferase WcaL [Psychroflexus gondwanensis ACAM 44]|uniref:Colanic acid biosynthesis glycosyltransferase WcaL n=1 Tax=Psychroflexus gondwanensis ACAM 44 TaxID=1189619 RepID=N1WPB8_9FLAO|nr:glycosyltransferase family 4 protein [Psychroflexus gondwanensis]EMY80820.1 colanic acid biosynthesis glycosyltransferase WcaL [Psychroflexus gondwanensis ACAM 44]